jgi:hypothetical protein
MTPTGVQDSIFKDCRLVKTPSSPALAPAPLDFLWDRPADGDGFVVREWGGDFLKPKEGAEFDRYAPMKEETGLFRNFSEVPPTADGILAFANSYGELGTDLLSWFSTRPTPDIGDDLSRTASSSDWVAAIMWMDFVIRFWDAARTGDTPFLRNYIAWRGKEGVVFHNPPDGEPANLPRQPLLPRGGGRDFFLTRRGDPQLMPLVRPGDLAVPAKVYVQKLLNFVLARSASPQMVWSPEHDRPLFQWLPHHLFGAMCVQLAMSIGEEKEYRRCQVCGKWFELSPGVNRKSRLTCSAACRNKAYRERQEEARRMSAAGKSVREIAKALDADLDAVKAWVKAGEANKGTKGKE